MNNVACSNAMNAMAAATSSMAADYEGQLQQLKQANEGLLKQVQKMADDQSKALAVFYRLNDLAINGRATGAAVLCDSLIIALSDSPWTMPNPPKHPTVGSSGDPKTTRTS